MRPTGMGSHHPGTRGGGGFRGGFGGVGTIIGITGGLVPGPGTAAIPDNRDGSSKNKGRQVRQPGPKQPNPKQKAAQRGQPRDGFSVPPATERRLVNNEVLLNTSVDLSEAALNTLARRHRLTRLESVDLSLTGQRWFRLRIDGRRSVASVITSLRSDIQVAAAQPNYVYDLQEGNPVPGGNTPDHPQSSLGDPAQYALSKLRIREAHGLAKGTAVLVAVVDSGVDSSHPDLAGVIAERFNATTEPDQPHSHGTGMTAAIAANGRVMGTAPSVKILAVQAFGGQGRNMQGTTFNIARGIDWATKSGARIINMSFAGPADRQLQNLLAAAHKKGIVLIAAVGNAGSRSAPLYPAADPNVIAVTATDADDKLFGRANHGKHIAVAAPGVDVLVATPNADYQFTSGTSVAAAQVSGIAALLIERAPKLDPAAVRRIFISASRDLGRSGHDDQFGAGLIDAYEVVMSGTPRGADASNTATPSR